MEIINGIKVVKLDNGIHSFYMNKIKGNKYNTPELTALKLTRNILLAKEVSKSANITTYQYGCLYIALDVLNNTVYYIENVKGCSGVFDKDEERYRELNELLGIDELENQCLEAYKERKRWAMNLNVSERVIDYFRKQVVRDEAMSDNLAKYKIKNQIALGIKLEQFDDQKEKGRQYFRNGKVLYCVKDGLEVVFIKMDDNKHHGNEWEDIA